MGKKRRTNNSHAKRLYETRGQLCILSFTHKTDCSEMTTQALWVELFMKPLTKRFGINLFPYVSWLFVAALLMDKQRSFGAAEPYAHVHKTNPLGRVCIYMAKMKYSPYTLCFTIIRMFWFTWAKLMISFKFICLIKIYDATKTRLFFTSMQKVLLSSILHRSNCYVPHFWKYSVKMIHVLLKEQCHFVVVYELKIECRSSSTDLPTRKWRRRFIIPRGQTSTR